MVTTYKSNFDKIAKIAGVALGFAIPVSNVLTNCCVVVLLLAWCFSGIKQKLQIAFTSRTTLIILCLLMVYVIGVAYSPACATEIKLMLKKMSRLLLIPVIMSIFTDAKWRKYALYSFWWAICISLLLIVIKYFVGIVSWDNLLRQLHVIGLSTPLTIPVVAVRDRIFTSLFFSFAVFSLLHYSQRKTNSASNERCSIRRICKLGSSCKCASLVLATVCIIYLFAYCDGRSGQVICLGLLEMFLLQSKVSWKKIFLWNVLLFSMVFCVWQVSNNNKERYLLTVQEIKEYIFHNNIRAEPHIKTLPLYNQSTGLRLEFLKNSLKLVKTSPWFGYGTGSFRAIYNKKHPLHDDYNNQIQVNNPHNQYVLTLVELGAVGFFALLGMFFMMLYESTYLPNLEKYLMQGVLFSIVVGCMANSWLMDFTSMHYFVYFMGVFFGALPGNIDVLSSTGKRCKLS